MPKSARGRKNTPRSVRAAAAKKAVLTRKRRADSQRAAATKKRKAAGAKAKTSGTRKQRRAASLAASARDLSRSPIVAFLATADSQRALAFYQSILGLRLVADEPFALVFDGNGVMIRLQKVEAVVPVPYTVLGWHVSDIAAVAKELGARGVALERYAGLDQDGLGVWRSPSGAKVGWFKDTDGNVLSLTQW